MRLGVDIDGVLADSLSCWVRELNLHFKANKGIEDIFSYKFDRVYGVTWEEVDDFFRSKQQLLLSNLEPVEHAAKVLHKLHKHSHIYLITARPEQYRAMTEQWLDTHNIEYDGLYMTDYNDKSSICAKLKLDYFIEDSLDNAKNIAQHGIPVLLFSAPYNQGTLPATIKRVYSWKEVAGILPL